ncbi:hypothetical protein DFA_10695 [Cavenderia fasciculata]|uniref:Uncharacterized protein n=1 Tax=Cavenderia fasciculata TaxID=261658 RepID=F4QB50_CACFS|nr:uncharacterized protein DFA_10695 [Cavenderia fasciculata]EGG14822.1 hypothetical protein DFA_10695 [Cavenderia fasciculata]|eukprot:XP_004351338.1 hypothetical protein DFA_10695 [Cavenderia fasciculata]
MTIYQYGKTSPTCENRYIRMDPFSNYRNVHPSCRHPHHRHRRQDNK